jgi:hypothetical protein
MRAPPASQRAQRAARAALLAGACALVLGACGGGEGDTSTVPAEPGTTTSAATTADPGPASELRDEFNELVTETLTGTEGLSAAVARCAVKQLDQTIDDDDLSAAARGLAETGEVPADLVDAAFEAGRDCADQGGAE